MKVDFTKFKPLPERRYDLNSFESYPHYITNSTRKKSPQWRCFAIFSPSVMLLVLNAIHEHKNSEYYIHEIPNNILSEQITNLKK